jgi:hypothetical protein
MDAVLRLDRMGQHFKNSYMTFAKVNPSAFLFQLVLFNMSVKVVGRHLGRTDL